MPVSATQDTIGRARTWTATSLRSHVFEPERRRRRGAVTPRDYRAGGCKKDPDQALVMFNVEVVIVRRRRSLGSEFSVTRRGACPPRKSWQEHPTRVPLRILHAGGNRPTGHDHRSCPGQQRMRGRRRQPGGRNVRAGQRTAAPDTPPLKINGENANLCRCRHGRRQRRQRRTPGRRLGRRLGRWSRRREHQQRRSEGGGRRVVRLGRRVRVDLLCRRRLLPERVRGMRARPAGRRT